MSERDLTVEVHSKLEPLVIAHLCTPILGLIPRSVRPNTISVVNVIVAALAYALAAWAPSLDASGDASGALWTRIASGICIWAFMIADCLDGMQARRTGQCSRFGEFLDHWLDAVSMPLAASALIVTLQLDPYTTAAAVVTTVMVYNAQLVIHHHTGRFIHPPTSGMDAQLILGFAMVAFGIMLYFVDRQLPALDISITVFSWTAILGSLHNCWFFYDRMHGFASGHVKMVGAAAALSLPYFLGYMNGPAYCVLMSFLSFRLCGMYVLTTLTDQPYDGMDWSLVLWAVVIVIAGAATSPIPLVDGLTLQNMLPYAAAGHMLVVNLLDVARALPSLRETEVLAA